MNKWKLYGGHVLKVLKSKKVIAALVSLALAVAGVLLGVDIGAAGGAVTEATCQVVGCV